MSKPVLPPLTNDEWPDEIADLLGDFAGGLNVYRTMAHHPALLRAWAGLREHVVNRSALGKQRSEVVILRTGFRLRSDYEWSQHILRARKSGLDDRRIAALRGHPEGMAAQDSVLAQAVDELFDSAALSEITLNNLMKLVGRAGVMDLMTTVGFYSTLGFILNTFGTPLDPEISARLAAEPLDG